jgi:hypothetical protein
LRLDFTVEEDWWFYGTFALDSDFLLSLFFVLYFVNILLKEISMTHIYLIYTFLEMRFLGTASDQWWSYVPIFSYCVAQLFFAKKVGFEANFSGVEGFEIDVVSVFDYSHSPIECCLIFTKCSRLRSITKSTFHSECLDPTIIKVGNIFLQAFKCLPE